MAFSGWLIALGAILAITHTPWFWNKEGRQMSPGAGKYAAYDAFHRVLFSAGVSYMAVACAWGSGGKCCQEEPQSQETVELNEY